MPPEPPPLPYVAPQRLLAGAGLAAAPVALLLSVLVGLDLPGWVGYLLVAWFVGGFVHLVKHMRRHPDDPWDDGARV